MAFHFFFQVFSFTALYRLLGIFRVGSTSLFLLVYFPVQLKMARGYALAVIFESKLSLLFWAI